MAGTEHTKVAIIGAGLSGLAVSHHLHHENVTIFEATDRYAGHVHSEVIDGFTWDDGPHVSFTINDYVREFLTEMVDGEDEAIPSLASNYYRGHWIAHPAQVNLYQVPEPLRTQCLESFLQSRGDNRPIRDYRDWLHVAFGEVFAETFPAAYTRKYWTVEPAMLATDWVGNRVMKPSVEEVQAGAIGPLGLHGPHYHHKKEIRYPRRGGFMAYTHKMAAAANIRYNCPVVQVNFGKRNLRLGDGSVVTYDHLVSTMPLKKLILESADAPQAAREAAAKLTCTDFLRVDVTANHPTRREEAWMYVYDEDKLSVRVSTMDNFSKFNAPAGCTAIQVEVYGSEYRPCPTDHDTVKKKVISELVEMGLLDGSTHVRSATCRHVPQGNPIFDHNRAPAIKEIRSFLGNYPVQLVGRYGVHRYLMTDACIISARNAAEKIRGESKPFEDPRIFLSNEG
jgi:protoporphyrinogen oxidase